ncbi:MAG: hypothetical protein NZ823_14150 [Blastocatellia bacterium]|nr:hypothetical protein [Blastocatellia bacterium]
MGIMKEGRKVMERTREELTHEDIEQLYLDYMHGSPEPDAAHEALEPHAPQQDSLNRTMLNR